MAKRKQEKGLRVGQVVFVGYAREYRRIVRFNEYGVTVGTCRSNVGVQWTDIRPLTRRERGGKQCLKEAELRAALKQIQVLVRGDRLPYWKEDGVTVTLTRGKILDICDRALVAGDEAAGQREQELRDELHELLQEVAEGRGPFKLDNHEFANSVIETAKANAKRALEIVAALAQSAASTAGSSKEKIK